MSLLYAMRWSRLKDWFTLWASRTKESRLLKFTRVNPVHPFDRRAPGVYVFNKIHTNHLITATCLLIAATAYFASLGIDFANFSRLDQIFFPCIAFLIGLLILWRNIWTYSVVLNYPLFRYEYYVNDQVMAVGPIVDVAVRLKMLFAGEEDMFYKIVVCATDMPELDVTGLSEDGELYRKVGKKLAATLNLNYFDIMDLSHLHECRHATSRSLKSVLGNPAHMSNVLQSEIQRQYLTQKVDTLKKCGRNPLEICTGEEREKNWPFLRVEEQNFGVTVETLRKLEEEKRKEETWSWWFNTISKRVREVLQTVKIGFLGEVPDEPRPVNDTEVGLPQKRSQLRAKTLRTEDDELDEREKKSLVTELHAIETDIKHRAHTRPLLKLRTNSLHKKDILSVDQRITMQLVARFMALRTRLRAAHQPVPGITEDLGFVGMYTAHREYPKYYQIAMQGVDPSKRSWYGRFARKFGQVHPETEDKTGRQEEIPLLDARPSRASATNFHEKFRRSLEPADTTIVVEKFEPLRPTEDMPAVTPEAKPDEPNERIPSFVQPVELGGSPKEDRPQVAQPDVRQEAADKVPGTEFPSPRQLEQ